MSDLLGRVLEAHGARAMAKDAMATAQAFDSLPEQRHSAELRKAVIAATIGTTIEWYDFFIYGTAAGLVFGKLYFPNHEPLSATPAAIVTYLVAFPGRPLRSA